MCDVKVVCVVHRIIINLAHAIKRMKCFHPEFNGMEYGLYGEWEMGLIQKDGASNMTRVLVQLDEASIVKKTAP